MEPEPYINAHVNLPEITLKVLILSILLALLLAVANTYLALKIGILTSASIPAAVLAMGILRFFRSSNILETNLIQTAASAGEAIAGGIVYTVPALIILRYWSHFNYWQTASIALIGGIIGVLFSIPLRRVLVTTQELHFPEGRAIAEVLKFNLEHAAGFRELLLGGFVGALIELLQTGFKFISNQVQWWMARGEMLFGFGFGFSATMIGAGYIIGFNTGLSIFIGAIIAWLIGIPLLSLHYPHTADPTTAVMQLYGEHLRYLGIGAMLVAGVWTLSTLIKPFWDSFLLTLNSFKKNGISRAQLPRTEKDMPFWIVLVGVGALAIWMYFLFQNSFHVMSLGLSEFFHIPFMIGCVLYAVIIGFIFAAICGYFSGLVGVTASPGSAIIIGGILIAAFVIRHFIQDTGHVTVDQLKEGAAITIFLGAIITGAAAIANDNIQDLKVGHLIGATPWKQQLMLILGAIISALIIPYVMELLFNVYGIAGVFPHPNMDPHNQLPAPPAALMATITQGVFQQQLAWMMLGCGVLIIFISIFIHHFLEKRGYHLSILGIAIGMYLPLSTTTPIFLGALLSLLVRRKLHQRFNETQRILPKQRGLLLACGLVAGAALMDVLVAIPLALSRNPAALTLMPSSLQSVADALGVFTTILLMIWIYKKI